MSARAALRWAAPVAAATVFLPSAASGLTALILAAVAAASLDRQGWRAVARANCWTAALLAWLTLSALWSPAPAADQLTHLWRYVALGAVLLLAQAVDTRTAEASIHTFIAAAGVLALAQMLGLAAFFEPDGLLGSVFHYRGNKGIANGAALALAAVLALHLGMQREKPRWLRLTLLSAAVVIAGAVVMHSAARTSFAVLALLGLVAVCLHWRDPRAWLALAVLCVALVVTWGQGQGGLALRQAAGQLSQSDDQRRVLYRETWAMVVDRPLAGHGLGSWPTRWAERQHPPELARMNTPHQEWLLTLQQGGLVAGMLLLAVFAGWLRSAWQADAAGPRGVVVLVISTWLAETAVNAAIRDAVFAVPMMIMLGLALAAAGPPGRPCP